MEATSGKYGKNEAVARLKAGTMKFRKSPSDPRFFEFLDSTEYYKWEPKQRREELSTPLTSTRPARMTGSAWRICPWRTLGRAALAFLGNLDDMEMEPELKDFFQKQLAVKDLDEDRKKDENKKPEEKKNEDKKA